MGRQNFCSGGSSSGAPHQPGGCWWLCTWPRRLDFSNNYRGNVGVSGAGLPMHKVSTLRANTQSALICTRYKKTRTKYLLRPPWEKQNIIPLTYTAGTYAPTNGAHHRAMMYCIMMYWCVLMIAAQEVTSTQHPKSMQPRRRRQQRAEYSSIHNERR